MLRRVIAARAQTRRSASRPSRPATGPTPATRRAAALRRRARASSQPWLRVGRRPPPREAAPPLRPALAARSRSCAKLRCSLGTLAPPRRAISRRRSGSIAAKPRRLGRREPSSLFISMTLLFSFTIAICPLKGRAAVRHRDRRCPAARRETPPEPRRARTQATGLRAAHLGPSDLAQLFSSLLTPHVREESRGVGGCDGRTSSPSVAVTQPG